MALLSAAAVVLQQGTLSAPRAHPAEVVMRGGHGHAVSVHPSVRAYYERWARGRPPSVKIHTLVVSLGLVT